MPTVRQPTAPSAYVLLLDVPNLTPLAAPTSWLRRTEPPAPDGSRSSTGPSLTRLLDALVRDDLMDADAAHRWESALRHIVRPGGAGTAWPAQADPRERAPCALPPMVVDGIVWESHATLLTWRCVRVECWPLVQASAPGSGPSAVQFLQTLHSALEQDQLDSGLDALRRYAGFEQVQLHGAGVDAATRAWRRALHGQPRQLADVRSSQEPARPLPTRPVRSTALGTLTLEEALTGSATQSATPEEKALLQTLGVRSAWVWPLLQGQGAWGVLAGYHRQPHALTAHQVETVHLAVSLIRQHLLRYRTGLSASQTLAQHRRLAVYLQAMHQQLLAAPMREGAPYRLDTLEPHLRGALGDCSLIAWSDREPNAQIQATPPPEWQGTWTPTLCQWIHTVLQQGGTGRLVLDHHSERSALPPPWQDPGQCLLALSLPGSPGAWMAVWRRGSGLWSEPEVAMLQELARHVATHHQGWMLHQLRGQLRRFSEHYEQSLDRERAAIALMVHDELCQSLAATRITASMLGTRLSRILPHVPMPLASCQPDTATLCEQLTSMLDEAIGDSRQLIQRLHPAVLRKGLHAGLEWLAQDFHRRFGLAIELQLQAVQMPLGNAAQLVCFCVAREALQNIQKHAQASRVMLKLELQTATQRLELQVLDDGQGFDTGSRQCAGLSGYLATSPDGQEHFGVFGMRERAAWIGADLTLQSAPGRGTRVTLSIPLQAAAA